MIKRTLLLTFIALLSASAVIAKPKKTKLSSMINNYQGDMVYYDCMQSPFINQSFHQNQGETYEYEFEIENITTLIINGRIKLLLMPGDNLNATINYDGKNISSVDFKGTKKAIATNEVYRQTEQIRQQLKYKAQLLACLVVDVKPKERIEQSREYLKRVKELLAKEGKNIYKEAADYILAEAESMAYTSFMEYPKMYESGRKLAIDKQEIGNFWDIMNDIKITDSDAKFRCLDYANLLIRYNFFVKEKEAKEKGLEYKEPGTLEDLYKEMSEYYEGKRREFVLYNLICNYIRGGKDIGRAEALVKDFKEKYAKNKEYINVLDSLMQ